MFRLLIDGPREGAVNMAVDETLLNSASGGGVPTVRFYRFSSPTLTFGYGQRLEEICDEALCRRLEIDCVRRITGGRALLHDHELTYSVATVRARRSRPGPREHYRLVSGAIRDALATLGVPVDPGGETSFPSGTRRRAPGHLPCLSVGTGHEITARGEKLVASAMRSRGRGVLIHGAIFWSIDEKLSMDLFTRDGDTPLRAVGIRDLGTSDFGDPELIDALTLSFQELFDTPLEQGSLTASEAESVGRLKEKYRSERWTIPTRRLCAPG